jgi:hypothetical protein
MDALGGMVTDDGPILAVDTTSRWSGLLQ